MKLPQPESPKVADSPDLIKIARREIEYLETGDAFKPSGAENRAHAGLLRSLCDELEAARRRTDVAYEQRDAAVGQLESLRSEVTALRQSAQATREKERAAARRALGWLLPFSGDDSGPLDPSDQTVADQALAWLDRSYPALPDPTAEPKEVKE